MASQSVIERLDAEVNDFVERCLIFREDAWTPNRCRAWVLQHRQNTRQRNSVLKLKTATNCSVWDIKLDIIHACSQEIIADNEFGGGDPHWKILEDLGVRIGMDRDETERHSDAYDPDVLGCLERVNVKLSLAAQAGRQHLRRAAQRAGLWSGSHKGDGLERYGRHKMDGIF